MEFLFHLHVFTAQHRLLSLSLLFIAVRGPSIPRILGSSNQLFNDFMDTVTFNQSYSVAEGNAQMIWPATTINLLKALKYSVCLSEKKCEEV